MPNEPMATMMAGARPTRREFLLGLALPGAASLLPMARTTVSAQPTSPNASPQPFRVRTLTAGVAVKSFEDVAAIETALRALARTRRRFEDAGYEVQTIRIATPSLLGTTSAEHRSSALAAIRALDRVVADGGALLSIGSVLARAGREGRLDDWASDLVRTTRVTSFSVTVASPDGGVFQPGITAAAGVIAALSRALPGGVANFRFAAAANVAPGTPFFPVACHDGPDSLAVGLETPRVIRDAGLGAHGFEAAEERIRERLDSELAPVAALAMACAQGEGRRYLGIDPSPAPGMDSSIGEAIEALTGLPFGGPSTLGACAAITGALKQLRVATCGYAGLMLPVLEDPVLARRAAERRCGIRDLLLFSSVCGTGLDVVPLPGNTSPDTLARIIGDVATLAVRLRKPLSARLFPVPGKAAGEEVAFDDPLLTNSIALNPE